jgi:uncharacterized protein (TIGR02996 family)
MQEEGFLRAIQETPGDNSQLLIYADWLDEQEDPISAAKSEFVRISVELATVVGRRGGKRKRRQRLRKLAQTLAKDWLALVTRAAIENCLKHQGGPDRTTRLDLVRFNYVCPRRWEELRPTAVRTVRFCEECRKNVHYCGTIQEARQHAWAGHCVTVDLGVLRRENDLAQPRMLMGVLVSPSELEREADEPGPASP